MATYLHENPEAFQALIKIIYETTGTKEEFLIKDYFTVLALREITKRNPAVVFKGGTCLSKCYGVINRFSEDIDLGLEAEHATEGMRKRLKRCVVESMEALGLPLLNLEKTRSRREFNRYIASIPFGDQQDDVLIVETAVMSPTSPTSERVIESFVGRYFAERSREDLIERYGLEPFSLTVNSLERTFCDKIFAVCDYVLAKEPFNRQSRHIYDLYQLLNHVELNDELFELLSIVRKQRQGGYRTPSAEPSVTIAEILTLIVSDEDYRDDYEKVTYPLLYDGISYDEAINSLTIIAKFLKERGW